MAYVWTGRGDWFVWSADAKPTVFVPLVNSTDEQPVTLCRMVEVDTTVASRRAWPVHLNGGERTQYRVLAPVQLAAARIATHCLLMTGSYHRRSTRPQRTPRPCSTPVPPSRGRSRRASTWHRQCV
jgi:hypothetical protein